MLRAITRWAGSEAEAGARLTVAVREQDCQGDGAIAADTRMTSATQVWLSELERSELAASTRQLYQAAARRYLTPALGGLLIGELTVPALERALATIRSRHGPQPARAATGPIEPVPVRRAAWRAAGQPGTRHPADRLPPQTRRALTVGEAADLAARLRADPSAARLDLPDFVEFMLGTGVRIGEACAIREATLDLKAGTVHINATGVRVNGSGLQIQPRTKTAGSERILHLPPHLVRMLKRRQLTDYPPGPAGVIFTSPTGLIRDPSNTQADLRQALDRAGYPWVSSHVFRKTVASRLDDQGYAIRHIADQLGHSRPLDHDGLLPRPTRAHGDRLRRRPRAAHCRRRVGGSFLVRFWFAPTPPNQNPLTRWRLRDGTPTSQTCFEPLFLWEIARLGRQMGSRRCRRRASTRSIYGSIRRSFCGWLQTTGTVRQPLF